MEGLECIAVSDRDGVMLVEGTEIQPAAKLQDITYLTCFVARAEDVPSAVIKPPFLGVFSIASEQVSVKWCELHPSLVCYICRLVNLV